MGYFGQENRSALITYSNSWGADISWCCIPPIFPLISNTNHTNIHNNKVIKLISHNRYIMKLEEPETFPYVFNCDSCNKPVVAVSLDWWMINWLVDHLEEYITMQRDILFEENKKKGKDKDKVFCKSIQAEIEIVNEILENKIMSAYDKLMDCHTCDDCKDYMK